MKVIDFDFRKKEYRKKSNKEHIIFDIINSGSYEQFIWYIENHNLDFNITDYYKKTILHHSIIKQKWKISWYILHNNLVDINAKTINGLTALDYAVVMKTSVLVHQLMEFNAEYDEDSASLISDILGVDL